MTLSEIKLTYNRVTVSDNPLRNSQQVSDFFREYLKLIGEDLTLQEKFFVIYLDAGMNVIGVLKVAESGIDAVMVDSRLIYSTAVTTGAKSTIVAHNHPSGTMRPSSADRNLTNKLQAGLATLDVELIDHIILSGADKQYYSFKDNLDI